jgi:hypothetical protein
MEAFSVKIVARDRTYIFIMIPSHFIAFETVGLYVALNGACGGNVDKAAITGSYKVSVSVYFASEGQITPPQTIIISQAVTDRNVCLFLEVN